MIVKPAYNLRFDARAMTSYFFTSLYSKPLVVVVCNHLLPISFMFTFLIITKFQAPGRYLLLSLLDHNFALISLVLLINLSLIPKRFEFFTVHEEQIGTLRSLIHLLVLNPDARPLVRHVNSITLCCTGRLLFLFLGRHVVDFGA